MKTSAPKETVYLKEMIKHETEQMMNHAESEKWQRKWADKRTFSRALLLCRKGWDTLKKAVSSLFPLPLVSPMGTTRKGLPLSSFAASLQVFLCIDKILLSLLFSRLGSHSSVSPFSYESVPVSYTFLWAFSHIATSIISVSVFLCSFANSRIFVSIFLKTEAFQPVKLLHYFPVRRSRKISFNYRCSDDFWSCDVQHPFPNGFEIG